MAGKLFRQKTKGMVEAPEEGGVSRAERLMEVGFMWHTGAVKPSFEERLDECREFRRKHDHLKVPLPAKYNKEDQSAYETREERSFLQWAQRQRDDYRKYNEGMKSSLDKNRIKKLDELGFDWEVDRKSGLSSLSGERTGARGKPKNHVAFNERIRTLSEIKDIYGDVNDIKNLKAAGHPETSPLYQWMKAQRKAWKALKSGRWSSLTQERIALLQSVDFKFQPRRHYAAYGSCKNSQSPEGTFRTGDEAAREVDDQYSSDQQETEFEEDDEEPLPPPPPGYERYRV